MSDQDITCDDCKYVERFDHYYPCCNCIHMEQVEPKDYYTKVE